MTKEIIDILYEAGKVILDIYADEEQFHTSLKEDRSPLTEADLRSNKVICDHLMDLFPHIPVISEETKQAGYEQRKYYKEYFLIDPLDGTKEFIKRNGEFTVNIAYLEGMIPVHGYVFVPCTNNVFYAQRGEGAFRLDEAKQLHALRSNTYHLSDQGIRVVASRSHRDPQTEKIISQLSQPEVVSAGSSLKFLLMAEGKADFYPRLAPTMEWDTAAAQCILEESGGSVLQYPSLSPLVYNKPDLLNPHFIATGALLDPESLSNLVESIEAISG